MTPAELDDALAAFAAADIGRTRGLHGLALWFVSAHPGADFEEFVRDLAESVQE